MRRLALSVVLAAVLMVPVASASAAKSVLKCGPGNRWCLGVFNQHNRLYLTFAGFGFKDTYRVCVTPPQARERCKSFGLRPNGTGANASMIRFSKHFPHARKGRYRVRWIYAGQQVGPTIPFTP